MANQSWCVLLIVYQVGNAVNSCSRNEDLLPDRGGTDLELEFQDTVALVLRSRRKLQHSIGIGNSIVA